MVSFFILLYGGSYFLRTCKFFRGGGGNGKSHDYFNFTEHVPHDIIHAYYNRFVPILTECVLTHIGTVMSHIHSKTQEINLNWKVGWF